MIIWILACDLLWNIGDKGELLIKIKEDLQRFKELTTWNIVLMGRTTFESIGRPLPYRQNIVISTQDRELFFEKYPNTRDQVIIYDTINLNTLEKLGKYQDVYIIGWAKIYEQLFCLCDRIELTLINHSFWECDTKINIDELYSMFPKKTIIKDNFQDWIQYTFLTLER